MCNLRAYLSLGTFALLYSFEDQCGLAVKAFVSSKRGLCCGYRQRPCGLTRRRGGVRSYSVSARSELSLIPQWDKRSPRRAGVLSMGLAERFFRVAKANLNSILKVGGGSC